MMLAFRILSVLGVVTMAVVIAVGLMSGGFGDEGSAIWALWWGKVTLIDLYVGLVLFGAWVFVRERRPLAVALWWLGLVVLGNLAAALYLVIASFTASSVHELLPGEREQPNSAATSRAAAGS